MKTDIQILLLLSIIIISIASVISFNQYLDNKIQIEAAKSNLQQCLVETFPIVILWKKECN